MIRKDKPVKIPLSIEPKPIRLYRVFYKDQGEIKYASYTAEEEQLALEKFQEDYEGYEVIFLFCVLYNHRGEDMSGDFHLFQRVIVLEGEYVGKTGVIQRILLDGANKGLWIELDNMFELKLFQPEQVSIQPSEKENH